MSKFARMTLCLVSLGAAAAGLAALVPPHPLYREIPPTYQPTRIEMPPVGSPAYKQGSKPVPNDIVVLRVQFNDVQFKADTGYPDYLAHDTAFFDRWMLHLGDFFADASHQAYDLDYYIHQQVITLPQTLAYYGADSSEAIDARLKEFTQAVFDQADPVINFSQFDGVIIFHAGAGQESDINGIRTEEIWSTFLTRKRLQSWFDEDNDAYPGYQTNDGAVLTNIVIVPESEYQDYFPGEGEDNADLYLFSIYGVLAHQFGHLLGLPTLFDNDSSDGVSQGIGNWGLMGTGVWNASGYVPAQLSPWCRLYLGWEPCITVTDDSEDLVVDYFLDHWPGRNRLYKVPISQTEYYLVENRQQNPDASLDPYSNLPSYSFKLLPEGEQDYYENYPLLPYFNFMENRYLGSEWDFMLPGLGGPIPAGSSVPVDGSGLLIWHIDENVIAEKFTANFDLNSINSNARHKGIDLEEADGIQHLDTGSPNDFKYGGPYDAFRAGNNDYFGTQSHNGVLWLPSAESYYGGIPLEIFDISDSGNQMTFSVSFGWRLAAGYTGTNPINACSVDFDGDGQTELFYPMPDGQLHLWKNELPVAGYPLVRQPIPFNYVWDGANFYLPMQLGDLARVYRLGSGSGEYSVNLGDMQWAAQPLSQGDKLFIPVNTTDTNRGRLYAYDKGTGQVEQLREFEEPVGNNLVYFRDRIYIPCRGSGYTMLWNYNLGNGEFRSQMLPVPADSIVVGLFKAPLIPGSQEGELIVQCLNSIYALNADLESLPGFPYTHGMRTTAPLSIADWDSNGSLDLILSSDLGVAVVDYSGSLMSPASLNLAASDSLGFNAGVLAVDLDHDGDKELLGSFGFNRLNCWEQDWRVKSGFPVSFRERSRNLPLIAKASDGLSYAWSATDNGMIFRQELPDAVLGDLDTGWLCEYGNLLRHASRDDAQLPNQYLSEKLFVPGEVYIYPNPLKSIYGDKLTLSVMTNRDTNFQVSIFDINGTLIFRQKGHAKAYLRNRELIDIPEGKFHSGVYIAVLSADTDSCRLKFAVEK